MLMKLLFKVKVVEDIGKINSIYDYEKNSFNKKISVNKVDNMF